MRALFLALLSILVFCGPAYGQAQVVWPDKSGGGGNAVPGLVGTTGNEETLNYLYNLKTFEALPAWPRYYFSADNNTADDCVSGPRPDGSCLPQGSDTNECSIDSPCRSFAVMEDIAQRRGGGWILVLDSFDDWNDSSDDFGQGGVSAYVQCGVNEYDAITPQPQQDTPCGFIVGSSPERRATIKCDDGVDPHIFTSALFLTSSAGAPNRSRDGYIGIANLEFDNCPKDPDNQLAIFRSTGGSMVLVNVHVDGLKGHESHFWKKDSYGNFIGVNTSFTTADHAQYHSTCSGHRLGCKADPCTAAGVPHDCCISVGGGNFECAGSIHGLEFSANAVTWISDKPIRMNNLCRTTGQNAFANDAFLSEPSTAPQQLSVIGTPIFMPGRTVATDCTEAVVRHSAGTIYPPSSGGNISNATWSRVLFADGPQDGSGLTTPWSDSVYISVEANSSSTGGTVNLTFNQNTFTDGQNFFVVRPITDADDTVNLSGKCNLLENYNSDTVALANKYFVIDGPMVGRVNLDFDGSNAYDGRDRSNLTQMFIHTGVSNNCPTVGSGTCFADFSLVTGNPATNVNVLGVCGAAEGGCFFGNSTTDKNTHELAPLGSNLNGMLTVGKGICSVFHCGDVEQTQPACPGYTHELPPFGFVPTAVVGQKIQRFNMGRTWNRMGTR